MPRPTPTLCPLYVHLKAPTYPTVHSLQISSTLLSKPLEHFNGLMAYFFAKNKYNKKVFLRKILFHSTYKKTSLRYQFCKKKLNKKTTFIASTKRQVHRPSVLNLDVIYFRPSKKKCYPRNTKQKTGKSRET